MKKNLIALAVAGIALLAGTSKTNAQMVSNNSSLEYRGSIVGDNDNISPKAIREFTKTHVEVNNESWTQTKDGYAVRFNSNGVRNTILYDKKGNWAGSIKCYTEEKMLPQLRHTVKGVYYDYKIVYVQEIETVDSEGVPTYIVGLEDETNIKLVKIFAGEMNAWKDFTKTN
jgi:hypothetical protein